MRAFRTASDIYVFQLLKWLIFSLSHIPPLILAQNSHQLQQQLQPSMSPLYFNNQFHVSNQFAQPQQNHHRNLAHGCKHYCSISQPNALSCWNSTLYYYEQMLVGLLRRTVAAQSNRVMWMYLNKQEKINYAYLENECYQRLKSLHIRHGVEDDNNWKNADFVYANLSQALLENVQKQVAKMISEIYYGGGDVPHLEVECPHGCERSWDTWKWMFILSLVVTFFLLAFFFFLIVRLDKREQISWTLEIDEINNDRTKVINSSSSRNEGNERPPLKKSQLRALSAL